MYVKNLKIALAHPWTNEHLFFPSLPAFHLLLFRAQWPILNPMNSLSPVTNFDVDVINICYLVNHCHLVFFIFYNKLTLAIFVPCDWCMWWSRTFVRGSRWAAIGDLEGSLLLESPSRHDNVGIYFGGELCFVINSSLVGS